MKRILLVTLFFVVTLNFISAQSNDVLYQVSTIDALLGSLYDGVESFESIKKHGDFGIGTFDALDGEMLALDGEYYQIKTDGKLYKVSDEMESPFATVVTFNSDKQFSLVEELSYDGLKEKLNNSLNTENIFYAIKAEGKFKYVKTRSVPRQEKPYPILADVVEHQSTFEFTDIEGTLVGFYCPPFSKGVNVPGYHFHFITKDKQGGGHVLAVETETLEIDLDEKHDFLMSLPTSKTFYELDLTGDKKAELDKVEK